MDLSNQEHEVGEKQQEYLLPPSQAPSSHFPLDPITADVLFDREVARRDGLKRRGNLFTGCAELDGETLLGGFERGCVVGISAEEEEMGLLIGLQTIAQLLVRTETTASRIGAGEAARAMIITTLSTNALMPVLRNALSTRALALKESSAAGEDVDAMLRESLEYISISRIFDFDGLCEVLRELDMATSENQHPPLQQPPRPAAPDPSDLRGAGPTDHMAREPSPKPRPVEIQDSEDEGGSLSSPASSANEGAAAVYAVPGDYSAARPPSIPPHSSARSTFDIILITHMSALLGALFSRSEKASAHALVQLLATQLRYLSRARQHDGPLVLVLNSTSSSSSSSSASLSTSLSSAAEPYGYGDSMYAPVNMGRAATAAGVARHRGRPSGTGRPLDPTLRSIFSPVPAAAAVPLDPASPQANRRYSNYNYNNNNNNKPAFGLVFAQLLDMHLLCTRVPRTRRDAEAAFAAAAAAEAPLAEEEYEGGDGVERGTAMAAAPRFAWVVEVLLDEIGVWDTIERGQGGEGTGRARRSREQRWGAVDIIDGRAVIDAFTPVRKEFAPVRAVGGFGGPRV